MAKKFLSKEGLERFFEKIKVKFAPIESPKFRGFPMVETPPYEQMSNGNEVINREYATQLYKTIINYVDDEKPSFHIRLSINPEDWEEQVSAFMFTKLQDELRNIDFDTISVFVRVDSLKLESQKLIDVQNHSLMMSKEGVIYMFGEKPVYELPIVIDLFRTTNLKGWLGGN